MTIDGVSATSDARGNLTSDGVRSFVYDSANRLTGTGSSTLSYDPLDRMTQMVGTLGARYLYDGDEIAGVVVASTGTTIANRMVRGPGADELAVAYQGNTASTPLWSLQDPQSSIIAITDGAGTAPYTLAYDEYGRPRTGNAGRLMYTGQLWMPDFGLYHYKARAYHPGLGRFVQTDPVGYEQGMNLYAYVGLDPMNATDPSGMVDWAFDDGGGSVFESGSGQSRPGPQSGAMYRQEGNQNTSTIGPDDNRIFSGVLNESIRGPRVRRVIERYNGDIEAAASEFGVDAALIKAVIYEEQSHQLPMENVAESMGRGTTVGLGQVTVGTHGFSRSQLLNPRMNIRAVAGHLAELWRQPLIDPARPIASVATRYNSGNNRNYVSAYGRRVESYHRNYRSGTWWADYSDIHLLLRHLFPPWHFSLFYTQV